MPTYCRAMRRVLPGLLLFLACFNGPAPDCRDPALASECTGAVNGGGSASSGPGGSPGNTADSGPSNGADAGIGVVDAGVFDAGFGVPFDGGPPM
jgi:hypothetical protein